MIGDRGGMNLEQRKEHHRKYLRERKKACKENGICPNCEKRPSAPNKVCCVQCLEDKKLTGLFGSAGPYRQLYAELFERQNGLCGICKKKMDRPLLDHCHTTMEIRGLLCANCNIGLGQFRDDPDVLLSALKYIQENSGIGIQIKKRD